MMDEIKTPHSSQSSYRFQQLNGLQRAGREHRVVPQVLDANTAAGSTVEAAVDSERSEEAG